MNGFSIEFLRDLYDGVAEIKIAISDPTGIISRQVIDLFEKIRSEHDNQHKKKK